MYIVAQNTNEFFLYFRECLLLVPIKDSPTFTFLSLTQLSILFEIAILNFVLIFNPYKPGVLFM